MKKFTLLTSCSAILFLLAISGCARDISSSSYDARTIGSTMETYECIVVSVRKVIVEEGDYLESNKTGALAGAIAGGVLGNAIGGGRGRAITTAAGALVGATGGAYAEKSLKRQNGLEYVVKLKSGNMRTVVQGMDNALYPGQSALLMIDHNGRSRVVARQQ